MTEAKTVVRRLVEAGAEKRRRLVAALSPAEGALFDADWPAWIHRGQELPKRDDWRVWVVLAGRGFGKTRAGAEWVSAVARAVPGARIALVAATAEEARRVMVEGPSGLLAVARKGERKKMRWMPTLGRLRFASGALAYVYSGANGEALRGPEHHFAWCDELAKWKQAESAWDNLMLGLRAGERPRALVTTTPKPLALLKALIGDSATAQSGGASWANPHASRAWQADMKRRLGGTRLGRQELEAVLFDDVEHGLWDREGVEKARVLDLPHPNPSPEGEGPNLRIVIGVDPPASAGGTCGIVACGMDEAANAYVLGDHSVAGASPNGWARKVAAAVEAWGADLVVAEKNNGGDMVASTLAGVAPGLPVKPVSASRGKIARAEPIAARFEAGQAWFAGHFPDLEDQLCRMSVDGYKGSGSPDRADAMIWAMSALFAPRAEPRISYL